MRLCGWTASLPISTIVLGSLCLRQSRRGGLVCATDLKLDFCYRPFATTHTEILNVHFQVSAQPVDARAVGDGNLHKEAET